MKHKFPAALLAAAMLLSLMACTQASPTVSTFPSEEATQSSAPSESQSVTEPSPQASEAVTEPSSEPSQSTPASGGGDISLNGDSITFTGTGISVDGSTVTINAPGDYTISGTLNDGQIIVNVTKDDKVKIILNGVTASCSTSAPFYVMSSDKTTITLADGTVNTFSDATSYSYAEGVDEPNACIFSKDDLKIQGGGTLIVNGNFNNGIGAKDDLQIESGNITVSAVNDGLKGKDSVQISGGFIDITTSSGDGIDSSNDAEADKGYVLITDGTIKISSGKHGINAENYVTIEGGEITIDAAEDGIRANLVEGVTEGKVNILAGKLDINAAQDGIQADTVLTIEGGEINIVSGGGSASVTMKVGDNFGGGGWGWGGATTTTTSTEDSISAKGLKGSEEVILNGGVITVDSADDAIHSNGVITINGGTYTLSSGDDGIHADSQLAINDGTVTVLYSYEGLEAAIIDINGGDIKIRASDDGLNAGGGTDSSGMGGFFGGGDSFSGSASYQLNINGGTLYVNADGDGLDSNGYLNFNGGTAIVEGPTDNSNGALDTGVDITLTGGYLLAIGSSGMAEYPRTPEQNTLVIGCSGSAGSQIIIKDAGGNVVLDYTGSKVFSNIVFSSADLITGSTYTVTVGGTEVGSATLTSGLNTIGSIQGGMGGGGRGQRPN